MLAVLESMPPIISTEMRAYNTMYELKEKIPAAVERMRVRAERKRQAEEDARPRSPFKLRRLESYGMTEMPCGQRTAVALGLIAPDGRISAL